MARDLASFGMALCIALFCCLTGCKNNDRDNAQDGSPADPGGDYPLFECRYENPYSHQAECKEYWGTWTEVDATADCSKVFSNADFVGTLSQDPCETAGLEGCCEVQVFEGGKTNTSYYNLPADTLELAKQMCGSYFKGTWVPCGNAPDGGEISDECEDLLAEALKDMVSDTDVTVDPECTDDACVDALVNANEWISFAPSKEAATIGLIFYPGGGVDPRSYAPILKSIAKEGYYVALVPMPGNSAQLGYNRAGYVMESHPNITSWFLGGHSMGGIGVLSYVKENPSATKGFIHWASYATSDYDVHGINIPATSIYGTLDGQSTVEEVEGGAAYMPIDTAFVKLNGANHAQFGHLCQTDADNNPDITRQQQHELVRDATLYFMRRVMTGKVPIHAGFAAAADKANTWCQEGQRIVFNPSGTDLPVTGIANGINEDTTTFVPSNAVIDATAEKKVTVQTLLRKGGNESFLAAPPIIDGEIWCKMKNQDSIAEALAVTPTRPAGTCATINEAILAWALEQLTADERLAYENSGKTISFLADQNSASSVEWLSSENAFCESATAKGSFELTSVSLAVGEDTSVPEEKRNVYYCKLWAPARALLWVLAQK